MILVIDDDAAVRMSLKLLLGRHGHEVTVAASPDEAMEVIHATRPDLVILDLNFSRATTGDEGLALMRRIRVFHPGLPVILITAWGSIPLAVEGIRSGAFDFITKPWDNATLLARVDSALSLSATPASPDVIADFDRSMIIGSDPALLNVLDTVRRIAPTDAPVLITGENGTGKELIAEALHRNSRRRSGPFVKVNLGGIASSLFESEMFGHRKGAFTGAVADRKGRFEMADGGTIFLDEIGDLDLNCQVKLLRVLQEHTFEPLGDSNTRRADFRLVCATNADLHSMVADRSFREDLFYRINLISLHLPALRERQGDIPLLVSHIIRSYAASAGIPAPTVHPDALALLSSLPWPGNVRQLKNVVERAILTSGASLLTPDHFIALDLGRPVETASRLEAGERDAVLRAMAESGGNLSRAAAILGITRQSLYRRLDKYGIR
ncbi:MAG: sigma-54 dependent transcriptional regulator [Muribaculaceae bacterium]|nr:sigma-54 dependent transcriptional regulator [Muribaculaceae bacterium]